MLVITLYPVHRRVGKGNLLLRQSVPHFPPNSGGIAWNGTRGTQRRALIRHQRHFISSVGIEPTTSRVYRHTLRPCTTYL